MRKENALRKEKEVVLVLVGINVEKIGFFVDFFYFYY